MKRNYYIAGFTWDGVSQLDRFKKEHIWENGYDEKYADVYNTMRVGDHIALKSTYVKNSKSYLRIHCMGVIKKIHADNMRVEVDWKECRKDLTDITWYANTLCKIDNEEHIKRIFNMDKYEETKQDLAELLTSNHNLILTGAPGTGKTYLAKQIAQQLIFGEVKENLTDDEKKQFDEQCGFVQFHPSYDYTDFVEGLRPVQDDNGNVGFERKDGVFKEFCINALKNPNKKFVFIIDEINRGEISKIFGELFFSIDPGYRGEKGKVRTQYANMQTEPNDFDDKLGIIDDNNFGHFFVPENVYIIGTMNDIDRSVESMDFAMRRRFAFKEIKADDRIDMLKESEKLSLDFDDIEKRMRNLNNCILSIQGLSSAYQIGASYFLKLENYLVNDQLEESSWTDLWNNHIEGLLFEYLRGTPNTAKDLEKLKNAYMNPDGYKYDNDGKVVAEDNTNE